MMRWEPLPNGFARQDEELREWWIHVADGNIAIGRKRGGYTYFLPDNIRLCRQVEDGAAVQVWKVTEERKEALYCAAYELRHSNTPELPDGTAEVLFAMLAEVE